MTKINTDTKPPPSGDKPVKTEAPTTTTGGGAEMMKGTTGTGTKGC